MKNGKRIIALIPARGGSKGLPGKNIRPLSGKPLICWSIKAAQQCDWIDRILISTDDNKIAQVAQDAGAAVPFMRPPELATDTAKSINVAFHAIDWFLQQGEHFDILILLQPTSPLRTSADITQAVDYLFAKKAQAVISVCEMEHHPYWTNVLPVDLNMEKFLRPEAHNKNRQELPKFYRLNGAIFISNIEYLRQQNGFFGTETFAYIMPLDRSIDIDSLIDFKLAELVLQENC